MKPSLHNVAPGWSLKSASMLTLYTKRQERYNGQSSSAIMDVFNAAWLVYRWWAILQLKYIWCMLNKQHCSSHGSWQVHSQCCACIARWSSWFWSGLEGSFMTAVACQNRQNEHVSVPNPVARRALCSWGKGKALPFDRPVFGPCVFPCCLFFCILVC